jgi:hypothetical protein
MTTTMTEQAIYCDCHGTVKMAVMRGDRIIIRDRRQGNNHTAVILLDKASNGSIESSTMVTSK